MMVAVPITPSRGMSGSRESWRLIAALVVLALVYLVTASRVDMDSANNDVSGTAFSAWRIADAGQPWLDDPAGRRYEPVPDRVGVGTNPDNGREVISRSPGVVAVVVPASWVARELGAPFGPVPQLVTAAILTTLAVALSYLALRRRLDAGTSLLVVAGLALTTPVWSVNANAMWTHVLTVLGIAGMSWAASTERWWLVGLFGGVGLWGRLHVALVVAVLGVGLAITRRRPDIAVKIGLVSILSMGLASVWSSWHYGSWVPSGGYGGSAASRVLDGSAGEGYTEGVLVNQLGIWVSPGYGILVWTPVLLLTLPGLVRRWGQVPDWARLLFIGGVVYTLVQAQIDTFTGGSGFYSYRHGLEFLASATPAIAHSLRGTGPLVRRVGFLFLALQFAAIAMGAAFDGGSISPERAWRTNALVEVIGRAPVTAALGLLLAAAALVVGYVVARRLPRPEDVAGPAPPAAPGDPGARVASRTVGDRP